VAVGAVLVASTSAAEPRTYRFDAASSRLTIQVFRGGALSGLGHDHLLLVQRWSGLVRADESAPESTQVELHAEADSLRDQQPDLSEADRAEVDRQTRDQVLEAGRYPGIDFVADHLELEPPGAAEGAAGEAREQRGTLAGTLTLHGRSRPVRIAFRATAGPDGVAASGDVHLGLRDYGIKAPSAGLGLVKVKDDVVVRFELKAAPGG
jgi:polyisoprenoid-binding protein YceI